MFSTFELVFWGPLPLGLLVLGFLIYLTHSKLVSSNVLVLSSSNFVSFSFPFVIFLFCLFYFILVLNFISLIPFSFPVSALVCISLFFALVGWLGNYLYVLSLNFKSNVAHFLPTSSPGFLSVFLIWVEFISWLARPVSLGVRLVANITAGHLLVHLMSSGIMFSIVILFVFILFLFLEMMVAAIQAYVYSLLLSLYVYEGL